MSDAPNPRPWSARRPQNLLFSAVTLALLVFFMITAVRYIADGVGALVPYLMLALGPVLWVYYVWYWNFYRFEELAEESDR